MNILEKARNWCVTIRTKPTPLSEAIHMVQSLCDEIDSLKAEIACMRVDAAIGKLVRSKMISANDIPVSRCVITLTDLDEAMKGEK